MAFTCIADGRYDFKYSGAGITVPFTVSDIKFCFACQGGGGGSVNPGTPKQVTRYNSAGNNVEDSSGSDDPANGPTRWTNGLSVESNAAYVITPNSPNGTSTNLLMCPDPTVTSMLQAMTCPVSTQQAYAVADNGASTTGNVRGARIGLHAIIFDNQTVANDCAVPSVTDAGQASDAGASCPTGVERIGRITTVNSGAGTLAVVDLQSWDVVTAASSGFVNACGFAQTNAIFALAGNTISCDQFVTDDGAGNMTMKSLGLTDVSQAGFMYQKQGTLPALSVLNSVYLSTGATIGTTYGIQWFGSAPTVGHCIDLTAGDAAGWLKLHDAGAACGTGSGATFQTNSVNNTSQVLLNFLNCVSSFGYGCTLSNPSGGIEQITITTPFTSASDPTAPTLTPTNPGTTHYTYGVAGCEDPGCTRHSALVTTATTTGNATISGSNPIALTAYADTLYGYRFYVICRTASSGTPSSIGVIGTGAWKKFTDTGITADGSTCSTTYASNNTKLDDHCLGSNPSIVNAMLSVPCGIDSPPSSPNALDDEFTATGNPGDANNPLWTWTNQGSSTDALTRGEMIFIPQPGAGADSWRLLNQTSPATPWTFVMASLPLFTQGTNNQLLGVCVGDGTKFESWTEKAVSNGELEVDRWTNTTTFSANQYGLTIIGAAYPWTYFKLQNDGTNLNFSHSFDGINYFQDYTEAKGAFLGTITTIGICGESTSTAATPQLSIDYWRRTQ